VAVLFQLAMALGAPWGEYAMGGKYPGKFPPKIRIAAVIQLLILIFFGVIGLIRSGFIFSSFFDFSSKAIWFVVGFFVLGSLMNLITPSKKERNIWAPITFILLLASLRIALS
jgi:hypothetical protein